MKNESRCVVTKLEILDNELVAIHALEIINNFITGIYFHAYLKKDVRKYHDMYYLAEYQFFGDNYLQNFINFVGDSKLITYNEEFEKIKMYFPNNINHENVKIYKDLFSQARKNKININKKSKRGGLIDCTIFARLLFDKNIDKRKMIKMTGIYKERKYYKKLGKEGNEKEEEEEEEEDKEDKEERKQVKKYKKFSNGRFVVLDTDTTSFKKKNCRLIAIHAVEVKDGKLTGIFFHAFINKRDYNYDYMYFLAEYNYCLEINEKLQTFLKFIKNSVIVGHNVRYDIRHINKELDKYDFPKISWDDCFCTMSVFNNLQNYSLQSCAKFFNINRIYDYHKGIVDATVLAIIVCKMAIDNNTNYNIEDDKILDFQLNKRTKVYIFLKGKKFHLYSSCGKLNLSDRITVAKAKKIGKELCKACKRKRIKIVKYYY